MIYLEIGVVLLVLAFFAASALYKVLCIFFSGVINYINIVILWMGRSYLYSKVEIPLELANALEKSNLLKDDEEVALERYNPFFQYSIDLKKIVYKPLLNSKTEEKTSNVVNYESIKGIVKIDDLNYINELIKIGGIEYPISPPTKPLAVTPPPKWKPWVCFTEIPTFKPPYYKGILSILNFIVDYAYYAEIERLNNLKISLDNINNKYKARNSKLKDLWEKACAKYEHAIINQNINWDSLLEQYNNDKKEFLADYNAEKEVLDEIVHHGGENHEIGKLILNIKILLANMKLPPFISRTGDSKYDPQSKILIHEHHFPDLSSLEFYKKVPLKSGIVDKPLNKSEKSDAVCRIYPSLSIRLAAEIGRLDKDDVLDAVVINGWTRFIDKSTGQHKTAFCSSLFVTKEHIKSWNLEEMDPVTAFSVLKGMSSRSLEVTPIVPILSINNNDARFVDGKEILGNLNQGQNIAAMDWEDFEHLCRQLFEKAFADRGAEVKVTQPSRDQGVDAIIFDPDPLTGGKVVVQAKRYTNVVDVSAVRDLYGTILHEGAMTGILVTTSHFGADSYNFAKDKPIRLIDGARMLGLLEKYGYKFRIDLQEARSINNSFGRI